MFCLNFDVFPFALLVAENEQQTTHDIVAAHTHAQCVEAHSQNSYTDNNT